MPIKWHAGFNDLYAFAFKQLSLQYGVRSTNQNFPAFPDNTMPGDSVTRRRGGHRPPGAPRSAWKA